MPQRIQRSRAKSWRMPSGAIYVGRPTIWGNPFLPEDAYAAGYRGSLHHVKGWCAIRYRDWLAGNEDFVEALEERRQEILRRLPELRGHDLACWCSGYTPCHADALLELANR